ncbi:peptidase M14 [Acetobacter sp. LMG 1627]|uniref:Peptidase M14 n=1 Tax=Acetobacter conturbans TaxID=1737472 RepID=A0ABX0K378_9PROT|nr:peptidase M14 [Acetobacter conturbans]
MHQVRSPHAGPHVAITALMHGNEYAGAIVLADLLRLGFAPRQGTLSLIFLNLEAFSRFSPTNPIRSRFMDEDMNRLWGNVHGNLSRPSSEERRVRQLLPYIETVDRLLDLHSMLWPADPLILAGPSQKGIDLAVRTGTPALVIADSGHSAGPRLIDLPHFTRPDSPACACLLEGGQHWSYACLETTRKTVSSFLAISEKDRKATEPHPPQIIAEVTHRVTAQTGLFTFTQSFHGGDIIATRGTLIATDGNDEIRTPYDNCLLVMPNFRTARHHTAVRLARVQSMPT